MRGPGCRAAGRASWGRAGDTAALTGPEELHVALLQVEAQVGEVVLQDAACGERRGIRGPLSGAHPSPGPPPARLPMNFMAVRLRFLWGLRRYTEACSRNRWQLPKLLSTWGGRHGQRHLQTHGGRLPGSPTTAQQGLGCRGRREGPAGPRPFSGLSGVGAWATHRIQNLPWGHPSPPPTVSNVLQDIASAPSLPPQPRVPIPLSCSSSRARTTGCREPLGRAACRPQMSPGCVPEGVGLPLLPDLRGEQPPSEGAGRGAAGRPSCSTAASLSELRSQLGPRPGLPEAACLPPALPRVEVRRGEPAGESRGTRL